MSNRIDTPIHVLHVAETLGGGIGTYLRHLLENLSQMPQFEFTVLHGARSFPQDLPSSLPGVDFIAWSDAKREPNLISDLKALSELRRVIKRIQPNVIHLHSAKAGALGRIGGLCMGRRSQVLYTPHGLPFLQVDKSTLARIAYRRIEHALAKVAGQVIACSQSELDHLNAIGVKGICIPNGIPATRRRRTPPAKPQIILTVGRIVPQKNPQMFAELAERFSHRKDVKFVWAGDGPGRADLSADNIHVTGWLEKEALHDWFTRASVYISTASYEGLPYAGLEAMQYSLPLVMSDVPGNRDLVDYEQGLRFTTLDEAEPPIERLLSDQAYALEQGLNSFRHLAEHFSVETMTRSYKEIYEVAAQKGSGKPRRIRSQTP